MNFKPDHNSYAESDPTGFLKEARPLTLYLLAIVVGIISAFSTVGFIKLYELIRRLIYWSVTDNLPVIFSRLPIWATLAYFVVGGLFIGLFIHFIVPFRGSGHGITHFLYIYRKQQNISLNEGITTNLASNLSIALGASVGREAPLMHLAGSISSWICRLFSFHGHYYRVLLAAAVATALATSLHATFFALFFVLEVVAFSLSAIDLIPIALALFSGSIIREFFPSILPPTFWEFLTYDKVDHILYYAVFGIIAGLFAILFTQSLKYTFIWHQKSSLPSWLWPAIGGIALGLIAHFSPLSAGLSFDVIVEATTWATPPLAFVILFIVFKWLATYFSLSFGFSGGIITPSFLIGMFLGILYSICLSAIFPQTTFQFFVYAIAGSAIFTSAIIGAPLTLTILSFELTRDVAFSLNIFVGIVLAQLVLRLFKVDSCYHTQYNLVYKH